MSQDQDAPSAKSSSNEYLQPLAIASLAAIFGFGCTYYYRGDLTRAFTIGGVAFLLLFWTVLRGNKLKKPRETKASLPALPDTSEASKGVSLWPKVVVACLLLLGVSIAIYYTVRNEFDRRAKANRLLQAEKDDKVKRVRKVEFIFWDEVSNPSQPLADRVDAAAAEIKIPVHSIEKNWPG